MQWVPDYERHARDGTIGFSGDSSQPIDSSLPMSSLPMDAPRRLRALFAEDEPADIELLMRALRKGGLEASKDVAQTDEEFTHLVRSNSYDIVLADYRLPNWNGMESVEVLRREGLDIPVILVSGALGELTAVECIEQGAADYVLETDG
jgi:CheY-like chemotaxis protein